MQLNIITERSQLPRSKDPVDFLQTLAAPALIRLQGKNRQRCRAFCTLLHGNEPSGLQAIINFLHSGQVPAVNVDIFIASVPVALRAPAFSHRMLAGRQDLNRCFRPPFDGEEGKLAQVILQFIEAAQPECLIDMHNTSGSGPAFGVAITDDANHLALTSLWTNDLIMTDLRLGALMELSEASVPTVTIECGGARDHPSLIIAEEGLQRYFHNDEVLATPGSQYGVTCFRNPVRLELRPGYSLAYQDFSFYQEAFSGEADVIMPLDADRLNYGSVPAGEAVAWLGPKKAKALTAKDHFGQERLHEHFLVKHDQLLARHPLKLFMVTTNARIARKDCLFYFIDCALG